MAELSYKAREELEDLFRSIDPSELQSSLNRVEPRHVEVNTTRSDMVNHPNHYCKGGIECIEAIKASMNNGEFLGFCKGNCLKYIWRYEDKNGIEDLRKALVYLQWLIEALEE